MLLTKLDEAPSSANQQLFTLWDLCMALCSFLPLSWILMVDPYRRTVFLTTCAASAKPW